MGLLDINYSDLQRGRLGPKTGLLALNPISALNDYANQLAQSIADTTGQADYKRYYDNRKTNPELAKQALAEAKAKMTDLAINSNPGAVGMFAGIGAKTADKAMLEHAKSLLGHGKPAQEVWKETGWGIAPWDSKPRFEIDDSASSVMKNAGKQFNDYGVRKQGSFMQHGDLYSAYPDIEKGSVIRQSMPDYNGSAYSDGSVQIGLPRKGVDADKLRSLMLHEDQHLVQDSEGFARGGSPEDFDPAAAAKARDMLNWRNEVEKWAEKNWGVTKLDTEMLRNADQGLRNEYAALDAYDWVPPIDLRDEALQYTFKKGSDERNAAEKMVKEFGLDKKVTPTSAMDMYKQLAGEAEARLTQHRMNLTPEQRAAQYPYDPEYFKQATGVDINNLITRYGYNSVGELRGLLGN